MIVGITDKKRFPRLGKVRLGEKKISKGGKEYPSKLPHFNLVDAVAVGKVFGDKPVTLAPILMPGNPVKTADGWDFSSYWRTSKSAYGKSSGLFCRCDDGQTATRVHLGPITDPANPKKGAPADPQGAAFIAEQGLDLDVGEMFQMPCPADECPYFEAKRCKNLGSFDFMLPTVQGFGTWCIQTSSFHSIRNVESTLHAIANATGGVVAGIPLVLNLIPQQAQVDGKGIEIYVLELLCPHNLAQLAGLRRRSLAAGGAVVAAIEGPEPMPDDLYPVGGGALDADLGKAKPVKMTPAPDTSALSNLTRTMTMQPEPEDAGVVDDDLPFGPEAKPTPLPPAATATAAGRQRRF
jgi:hypothetical protein